MLESFQARQTRDDTDERRAIRQSELSAQLRRWRRVIKPREVHAIANDGDLRRVVPFANQPVPDCVGVDEDAVREPARVALHAFLHRGEVRRPVADRRDDDGRDQARRRCGEHVPVEVIGVHDLNAPAYDVPR